MGGHSSVVLTASPWAPNHGHPPLGSLPSFLLLQLVLPSPTAAGALQGYQEQGILFGYRPPSSSAADCLLSVFQMTNETLNIWTHFVPTW